VQLDRKALKVCKEFNELKVIQELEYRYLVPMHHLQRYNLLIQLEMLEMDI
jgi:hypothetical protein